MNILIFTLEFPPMLGGAGTYASELALGFSDIGHNVTVLTSRRGINHSFSDSNKYKVIRKKWSDKFWFIEWTFIINKYLKENKFDLIIFANQGAIIVGTRTNSLRDPYICTLHGSERYTFLAFKKSLKMRVLVNNERLKTFLCNAKKVICVSQDLLDDVKLLVDDQVTLERIPLGISNNFGSNPANLKYDNNIINIVCTARFVKGKGHNKVLMGVKELIHKTSLPVHLTFIGDGVEEENLKQVVVDLNLADKVSFKGLLSRDLISHVYSDMDVFIMLSSFKETFGLVYLEAMFSGLPVVGSDLGAVKDLIKEGVNGYLLKIEEQEPSIIADVLLLAFNNKIHLGANSLKMSSKYTNIAMAKSHLIGL